MVFFKVLKWLSSARKFSLSGHRRSPASFAATGVDQFTALLRLRAFGFALATLTLVLATFMPELSWASSAGCTIVNSGTLDGTIAEGSPALFTGTTTFAAGDKINYSYSAAAGAVARMIALDGGTIQAVDDFSPVTSGNPASASGVYTFSTNGTRLTVEFAPTDASGTHTATSGATVTWSVTCTPATTPAPVVSSVSPNSGSPSGGTSVTITGTNLTGATAVTFGATAATSFTVNFRDPITATAPAGTRRWTSP